QSRLGGGDAHLLLVAFLEHGPWAGAASHLVGGLLVSLLVLEIATRAVSRRRRSPSSASARRTASRARTSTWPRSCSSRSAPSISPSARRTAYARHLRSPLCRRSPPRRSPAPSTSCRRSSRPPSSSSRSAGRASSSPSAEFP